MTGFLLPSVSSAAFLPEGSVLKRQPRVPKRERPAGFLDKFEFRALVYDAFRHADGERILLVGPPPLNLAAELRSARYLALPSRTPLRAEHHISLSVAITALTGAPADTVAVEMRFGGESFPLPLQPNVSPLLAGRRIVFTMSKDNELAWIREWAAYHAAVQGADAVVFFDNGSTRYGPDDIAATLRQVPGIAHAAVLSWPYKYGPSDPAVRLNPFYALFLQIASMSVALRRYAAAAEGLLNCDIDELVATPPDTTVFELARAARAGLVTMRGQFVEAVPERYIGDGVPTHRDFLSRLRDPAARLSRPRKWALDPSRPWVQNLDVHPYMHWIEGRPLFGRSSPPGLFYWHFRGINTNWKEQRTDASNISASDIEPDHALAAIMQSLPITD
ncbi:MAG TPA: hypothetical protein VHB74_05275 [Devosia sp.]|nr:hypothetical protein [Devosia sp.]